MRLRGPDPILTVTVESTGRQCIRLNLGSLYIALSPQEAHTIADQLHDAAEHTQQETQ